MVFIGKLEVRSRHGSTGLDGQSKRASLALCLPALALAISLATLSGARAENLAGWPVLTNPFESTGGGGIMIDGYKPVVSGALCKTDFLVTLPSGGGTFLNEVEFDAVSREGGILCENGRWRAKDGSANGTTPFRVFIKDGIVRRPPA